MTLDALRAILDGLEEESCCSGTCKPAERVALALPDGDVGAVDDPGFVEWLLAHSEPAPFGDGTTTRVDPKVRAAHRLKARERVAVHGFDPAAILDEIEAVLSPGAHLDARLTDVVVYKKGGKFERHKDTPRAQTLIGTLVVGLPIAHTGGEFHVDDGRGPKVFASNGKPGGALPWVALFSDVDHEIKPVKSGARVTLVYALHRTDRPRGDARWAKRQDSLRQACRGLAVPSWPLMIACGRHAVAEPDAPQPQPIDTLRGTDRDIADALVEAGYRVGVRACIAAVPDYEPVVRPAPGEFPSNLWSVMRLKAVPPPSVIEGMDDEGAAQEIEEYILDSLTMDQWLVRRNAAAMLVHERATWAESGYFGNEGYDAILYTSAALEVTKPKAGAKAKPKAAKAKKPAPKAKKAKQPAKKPARKPAKKR